MLLRRKVFKMTIG
ncbi:hypothetical protein YPPY65_1444, partial [Yersinia pestis PY-65]